MIVSGNSFLLLTHLQTPPNLISLTILELIDNAYNEIVKWRKNLFLVLTGNKGNELIGELANWLEQFKKNSTFTGISIKAYIVLPSLLFQKPSAYSKTKDHIDNLPNI